MIRPAADARPDSVISAEPIAQQRFTHVPNRVLRDPTISVGAKTVYALLLSYAWHNDFSLPVPDRLTKDVGIDATDLDTLCKELEAHGLLEITRREHGKADLYRVNFVSGQR